MEQRKDYILNRWVFYATERKKRPNEFKKEELKEEKKICYFCPGNEDQTPPEIGRTGNNKKWSMRWFPNKFPAVREEGSSEITTEQEFFTSSSTYGKHEVVVETPSHEKQLWDLPEDKIIELLKIYRERITQLSKDKQIKYVVVFKNNGKEAGTSLVHSHTQVASVNIVPPAVQEEIDASGNSCAYCRIIGAERNSKRKCFENKSFIAIAPYASRFSFEVWIFPKKHLKDMNQMGDNELSELAEIMKKILSKLKKLNAPYNFFLHYSPKGENLHFHIEVTPRFSTWAGFEFGTGGIINPVLPEDAAKFYRGG